MSAIDNCFEISFNASHSNGTYKMCGRTISFQAQIDSLAKYYSFKMVQRYTRAIWI